MKIKIFVLLSSLLIIECKIPEYISVYKRTDPNLDDCITKSIHSLMSKLIPGIPELNVLPLEPLHIKNFALNSGSKVINFDVTVKDVLVWNISTLEILQMKSNIEENLIEFSFRIPQFQCIGNYEMDTKIMALHLKGQGPMSVNVTEYNSKCILHSKRILVNGVEHLKFEKMRFNIAIGSAKVYLENLFSGNENIGKAANDVINANIADFFDYIEPFIESGVEEVFSEIADKITLTFSFDELFPL